MQIVEEMVLFKPDLVIFCAGFDAHDEDPLASCELKEEDFAWATETGYFFYLSSFIHSFIHSFIRLVVFFFLSYYGLFCLSLFIYFFDIYRI